MLSSISFKSVLKFFEYRSFKNLLQIRSDQWLSHVWLFATPWIAPRQASLSITNSWNSLRLTSIESAMPSNHLILFRPPLRPPIPPSIRVCSNESTLHMRWPKHWSFSFSIIPSKEIPYIILFDAIVNGIVPLISLSDSSLLVYRNARDLCLLVLYPASVPNSLMNSSGFLVTS